MIRECIFCRKIVELSNPNDDIQYCWWCGKSLYPLVEIYKKIKRIENMLIKLTQVKGT